MPEAKDCGDWLAKLVSGIVRGGHGIGELPKNDFCRITFGDYPFSADPELRSEATFVGFTARGIAKLMRSDPNNPDGLSSFQAVFNVGMANRARVLGDFEDSAPERWRWLDSDLGGVAGQATAVIKVDAVLLIYGQSIDQCRKILTAHQKSLGSRARFHLIETRPAAKGIDYEHFGFRDGISQPVIRGTQRFSKGSPTRDIVEPGEFILGYRNNQHYYPPAVTVGADSDRRGRLPTVLKTNPTRFPSFDDESATRDFGRNGSFLVIRQLTQDVEGFKRFTEVTIISRKLQARRSIHNGWRQSLWAGGKTARRLSCNPQRLPHRVLRNTRRDTTTSAMELTILKGCIAHSEHTSAGPIRATASILTTLNSRRSRIAIACCGGAGPMTSNPPVTRTKAKVYYSPVSVPISSGNSSSFSRPGSVRQTFMASRTSLIQWSRRET